MGGRARLGVATFVAWSCAASGCTSSAEPAAGHDLRPSRPPSAYSDAPHQPGDRRGPLSAHLRHRRRHGPRGHRAGRVHGVHRAQRRLGRGLGRPRRFADVAQHVSARGRPRRRHLAAGTYDVEVRDPRGSLARLPGAFVSLGPDRTPPAVTIDEPAQGTIVNAEAEVPVAFTADDGLGYLASMEWKVSTSDVDFSGTCPLAPDAQRATCRFVFVAPQPTENGQPLAVVVTASRRRHPARAGGGDAGHRPGARRRGRSGPPRGPPRAARWSRFTGET